MRWALLLALISGCREESTNANPGNPEAATPAAPSTTSAGRAPATDASAGVARQYALEGTSRAAVGDETLTAFAIRANATVVVVNAAPDERVFAISLTDVALTSPIETLSSEFAKYQPELETQFFVEQAKDGSIPAYYFADEPRALVVAIRRWVAAALQVPPPSATAATEIVHFDATGKYIARFEERAGAPGHSIRKLRYVSMDVDHGSTAKGASHPTTRFAHSEGFVVVDDGLVSEASLKERQESSTDRMLPMTVDSVLSLSSSTDSRVGQAILEAMRSDLATAPRFDHEHPWQSRANDARLDETRIAGRSLDQLLAELAKVPAAVRGGASEQHERATSAFLALQAYIRRHPEAMARFDPLIAKQDQRALQVLDALGASGADHAHEVLVRSIDDPQLSNTVRKSAAIALSRCQAPTSTSLKALRRLLSDPLLGVQAVYGIGTSVRHLRERGRSEQASRLMTVILDKLRDTAPDEIVTQVHLLRGVANSGYEGAWSLVKPRLDSQHVDVRVAAVEALQLIRTDDARTAIAQRLATDESSAVRRAALRAARHQGSILSPAVTTAVLSDASLHVRRRAVAVLGAWLHEDRSLAEVLKQVAASDSHARVRADAESVLKGTTSG